MKTAEEIFRSEITKAGCMSMQVALNSMKEYAKQVAEQSLKDAAERATTGFTDNGFGFVYSVDKESILNTPIQTP